MGERDRERERVGQKSERHGVTKKVEVYNQFGFLNFFILIFMYIYSYFSIRIVNGVDMDL